MPHVTHFADLQSVETTRAGRQRRARAFLSRRYRCHLATRRLGAVALLALIASACSVAGRPRTPPVSKDTINRTLLASVRLSADQTVEFYEFEPGLLAVREVGRIDRAKPLVRAEQVVNKPLAELFTALSPQTPVPAALAEADRRARERLATLPQVAQPPERRPGRSESGRGSRPASHRRRAYDDFVNYDLDAQWFESNFCGGHQFADCYTNVGWAYTTRETAFFQVTGLNASFDGETHFWGNYRKCGFFGEAWGDCEWAPNWDEWLSPRSFSTWTWNTTQLGWRDAHIDGDLVDFGARYDGGSGTAPPQVGCGGHNQLSCNGACNGGLTFYEGACWACGVPGTPCCIPWDNSGLPGGVYGSCHAGFCSQFGGICQ